eukprot:COSAG04_NODE_133_length_23964_cov_7.547999_17_plen_205_part_00
MLPWARPSGFSRHGRGVLWFCPVQSLIRLTNFFLRRIRMAPQLVIDAWSPSACLENSSIVHSSNKQHKPPPARMRNHATERPQRCVGVGTSRVSAAHDRLPRLAQNAPRRPPTTPPVLPALLSLSAPSRPPSLRSAFRFPLSAFRFPLPASGFWLRLTCRWRRRAREHSGTPCQGRWPHRPSPPRSAAAGCTWPCARPGTAHRS